jgi:hypothetical protein
MRKLTLSYECREQIHAWVHAHCPCAFDDPQREFVRGLMAICLEESSRAVARERARAVRDITKPSDQ